MLIRRAKPTDLDAIRAIDGLGGVPSHALNKQDIALVAQEKKRIVGFVWCGLMSDQKLGYIDYFVIDPKFRGKGIGPQLAKKIARVADKKGVMHLMGHISEGQYFDASAMNALKAGMKSHGEMGMTVFGNTKDMAEITGAYNG